MPGLRASGSVMGLVLIQRGAGKDCMLAPPGLDLQHGEENQFHQTYLHIYSSPRTEREIIFFEVAAFPRHGHLGARKGTNNVLTASWRRSSLIEAAVGLIIITSEPITVCLQAYLGRFPTQMSRSQNWRS
jgi:hypothetical protein